MKEERRARLALISSMVVFGTIGVFRRQIPLPSSFLAMTRGAVGARANVYIANAGWHQAAVTAVPPGAEGKCDPGTAKGNGTGVSDGLEAIFSPRGDRLGFLQFGLAGTEKWMHCYWPYHDGRRNLARRMRFESAVTAKPSPPP